MRQWSFCLFALTALVRRVALRLYAAVFVRSPAQGLVEYGLILVLIMVVCVGILTMVGRTVSNVWYAKLIQAWP